MADTPGKVLEGLWDMITGLFGLFGLIDLLRKLRGLIPF